MDDKRVVDIWFKQANSFGSGYMLSDRLVLTAGHVAKPQAKGAACIVRRAGAVESELSGTLRWWHPSIDAALIDLAPDHAVTGLGPPPRFGRVRTSGGVVDYDCQARGFPRASRNAKGERDDAPFTGSAQTILRAGRYWITPRDNLRIKGADWSGFSGSAIFSGDLLFGIVAEVPLAYDGSVLHALPVADLFDDSDFRSAIMPEAGLLADLLRPVRHNGFYRKLDESLRRLYFYIDRVDQLDEITKALKPVVEKRQPPASYGFVIAGRSEDAPHMVVQRVASARRFSALFGDIEPDRAITPLEWPSTRTVTDVPAALTKLKRDAASGLCLPPDAAEDAVKFRAALGRRRAVGLWWSLTPTIMGAGHVELMQAWSAFCEAVQAGDPPLFTFICVIEEEVQPPRPSLFRRAIEPADPAVMETLQAALDAGKLTLLPSLDLVRPTRDIGPWIRRLAALNYIEPDDQDDLRKLIFVGRGAQDQALIPFTDAIGNNIRGLQ